MNRIRAWIRSFFGFSRTETNGFLILLPLCLLIIFIEPMYQHWFVSQPLDNTRDAQLLDSIIANWDFPKPKDSSRRVTSEPSRFAFDPNKISADSLMQLGFKKYVATRIVNFRSKGGKFFVKADLKKIYGIDTALVINLYSFISLPEKIDKQKPLAEKLKPPPPNKTKEIFDINVADTSQLIQLKGIGSKLSQRIIKYRDKLGGFVSQNQFTEVFGLDSLVIEELRKRTLISGTFVPRQININQATEKQLTALPYIKFTLAKAIVAYRYQHKVYNSVDELKNIAILDETLFQKIKPYLTVTD